MEIRIGSFNKLPVYLNISTPLQWFKQILAIRKNKMFTIAYLQSKRLYYDQLKAKHEGSISIIPEKDLPKNGQFISWIRSNEKIVVGLYFIFLPKLCKLFTLWHEYGHFIANLHDDEGKESSFYEVIEAIADFYACCKLRLHFDEYVKTSSFSPLNWFSAKRRNYYNNVHLSGEKRYIELYVSRQLPLKERMLEDYVYLFYRDKNALVSWYMLCFKDICNTDYRHFFDWDEFLAEIGWDNDEERWKYINYKENSSQNH